MGEGDSGLFSQVQREVGLNHGEVEVMIMVESWDLLRNKLLDRFLTSI